MHNIPGKSGCVWVKGVGSWRPINKQTNKQYELGHDKIIKNVLYELVVSIHTRAVVLRHDAGEKSLSNSPET